ncbi:MAG: ABC transporter ATP-binding protein, partial [Thermomicrobiales bacterium]
GEHWALLGPNGSGKTTLLSLAGAQRFPSKGRVRVLGQTLGETNLWDLRERIGAVDANQKVLDWLTVLEIVMTGQTNTVWPQQGRDSPEARIRASQLVDLVGCTHLAERTFTTCSQGERQRIRIARALMSDPPLLLLDEPSTGLDFPAREALMDALSSLAQSHSGIGSVIVSHHLEELPTSTTHAALLREGAFVAAGPIDQVLTSANVTECYGFPIDVQRWGSRWTARSAAASW